MAPKKSKAVPQKSSASQAVSEPTKPTRAAGNKRRHSDASNASDAVFSSQTPVKARGKRQKKTAVSETDQDAIIEEEETEQHELVVVAQPQVIESDDAEAARPESTVVSADISNKHVHFNQPQSSDLTVGQTAAHLTPFPTVGRKSKMTVKRRTLSPPKDDDGSASKRYKTKSSRTSLPLSLSQEEYDPASVIQELEFAPLRAVLDAKVRKLVEAKKHQRAGDTTAGAETMAVDDEDMLILDTQEEIEYPRLPSAPNTPLTRRVAVQFKLEDQLDGTIDREGSGGAHDPAGTTRAAWNAERKTFHDAIIALSREAEDAKARYQILLIELQALGFPAAEGEGAEDEAIEILRSIREAFVHTREQLSHDLINTLPEDVTNAELVEILIANVQEFAQRLRTADGELNQKEALVADLGGQVHALVDRLAERQLQEQETTARVEELEGELAVLEELETEVEQLREMNQEVSGERDANMTKVENLVEERKELEMSLERLTTSLQDYRTEETRLIALITKMEDEHRLTVASMNKERQDTVQDLEEKYDAVTASLTQTQQQSEQERDTIAALETRIEELTTEQEDLREELEEVRAELDAETEVKERAQADLDSKAAEIEGLEDRVSRLEEDLDEHVQQLAHLRSLHASESRQREAAEQDLDDRNKTLDDLNHQLHTAGQQANELRSKLFEVQQRNTEKLQAVEVEMAEREKQFQDDMAAEVERREQANDLAEDHATTIKEREQQLADVKQRLGEEVTHAETLQSDLDAKEMQLRDLQIDLVRTKRESASQADRHAAESTDYEARLFALSETISSHEERIQRLQSLALETAAAHESALAERDNKLAVLTADKAVLEAYQTDLLRDKQSLERRVEAEAEELLNEQAARQTEIDALRAALQDQREKILVVQEKAQIADARWTDVLAAREDEVRGWKAKVDLGVEEVQRVHEKHRDLQHAFELFVKRSNGMIETLKRQLAAAVQTVQDEGEQLGAEGELLAQMLKGQEQGLNNVTQGLVEKVELEEVVAMTKSISAQNGVTPVAAKKGKGRKKRVADSGIGLLEEEMVV